MDDNTQAIPNEPAWVTRFANRRAIESMAAQFICPKTTALELARQILQKQPPQKTGEEI